MLAILFIFGAVIGCFLLLALKLLGKNNQPVDLTNVELKEWKEDDDDWSNGNKTKSSPDKTDKH